MEGKTKENVQLIQFRSCLNKAKDYMVFNYNLIIIKTRV
jgi:hypothetical protein